MEFTLLKYKPQPWLRTDSLVLTGYMYRTLTDTREREIHRAVVAAKAGPELAKDLFSDESSMDHFVVGDPNVKEKANTNAADEEHDEEEMYRQEGPNTIMSDLDFLNSISKLDNCTQLLGHDKDD